MPEHYKIPDSVKEKLTIIKNLYNARYSKYTDVFIEDNGHALDFAVDLLYNILTREDAIEETPDSIIFIVKIPKKRKR